MTTWEKREGPLFYFSLFSHWGHNAELGKPRTARLHLLLPSKMRSHWWQWIGRRGRGADQITVLPSSNQTWMFCNRSRNVVCLALSTWVEFLSFWGGNLKKGVTLAPCFVSPTTSQIHSSWMFYIPLSVVSQCLGLTLHVTVVSYAGDPR